MRCSAPPRAELKAAGVDRPRAAGQDQDHAPMWVELRCMGHRLADPPDRLANGPMQIRTRDLRLQPLLTTEQRLPGVCS